LGFLTATALVVIRRVATGAGIAGGKPKQFIGGAAVGKKKQRHGA